MNERLHFQVDPSAAPEREQLPAPFFTCEAGLTLTLSLTEAPPADAAVSLAVLRSDGVTAAVPGCVAGSTLSFTLGAECFAREGWLMLTAVLTEGGCRRVIWFAEGSVLRTESESLAPAADLPSVAVLSELLRRLETTPKNNVRGYFPSLAQLDSSVTEPLQGDVYGIGTDSYTYVIRNGGAWVVLGDIFRPDAAAVTLWEGQAAPGSTLSLPQLRQWRIVAVTIGSANSVSTDALCTVIDSRLCGSGTYAETNASGVKSTGMVTFSAAINDDGSLTVTHCYACLHQSTTLHSAAYDRSVLRITGLVRA